MAWVHNLHAVDPQSHIGRDIAICLIFSTLAFVAVGVRFWIRVQTNRLPWADDFAALSSAVLGAAYTGIAVGRKSPLFSFSLFPLLSYLCWAWLEDTLMRGGKNI